jgi:hypothetical protein
VLRVVERLLHERNGRHQRARIRTAPTAEQHLLCDGRAQDGRPTRPARIRRSGWFFAIREFTVARFSCEGEGWIPEPDDAPPICELGDPGCSCTVQATCTGGTTCIDGMCQP